MAQLNPNFEIDFEDINSYEQIQLINDTQQAKEDLLQRRAYREPADEALIRNQFSSFTFVDFCPKLFASPQEQGSHELASAAGRSSASLRHRYELETFSDLFERINQWLRLNRDWRVVSMETLVFDCVSQFNHLESSVYARHLPRNMRGLRLFLSPSKARFCGAQRIGCINVVPRKLAGNYGHRQQPLAYESLDQILARLNELLLTRPIEGRILSVETITLPIANGYVNTETNYLLDSRLNSLEQCVHALPSGCPTASGASEPQHQQRIGLIDILRVYYEFGPMLCGLVNLIDFVPRFHHATAPQATAATWPLGGEHQVDREDEGEQVADTEPPVACARPQIGSTESLTRLVRRSLAWFELERKRMLESRPGEPGVKLKLCNLQVHRKHLLKHQLIQVTPDSARQALGTRQMFREARPAPGQAPSEAEAPKLHCCQCQALIAPGGPPSEWCLHFAQLDEPYEVKFVRLAYVVPVHQQPVGPLGRLLERPLLGAGSSQSELDSRRSEVEENLAAGPGRPPSPASSTSSSPSSSMGDDDDQDSHSSSSSSSSNLVAGQLEHPALKLLRLTNERHLSDELAHHAADSCDGPIGQLTYRLFAPCQLVNSSSCFAINPVNSSSGLARRGSVDLNGPQRRAEVVRQQQQQPTANSGGGSQLLLANEGATCNSAHHHHHQVISFGAFLPALSHEYSNQTVAAQTLPTETGPSKQQVAGQGEFESVEAMRRRMEVYVTTNSMNILAGETLVINLDDALSCLSTAIEQTVVRASFASSRRKANPSAWVSVYLLYAAVDEPRLPAAWLLERQRKLGPISEQAAGEEGVAAKAAAAEEPEVETTKEAGEQLVPVFEDHFKLDEQASGREQQVAEAGGGRVEPTGGELEQETRWAQNCAYERAVALPSAPDKLLERLGFLEPRDLQALEEPGDQAAAWSSAAPEEAEQRRRRLRHNSQAADHLWLEAAELAEAARPARGLELTEERHRRLLRRQKRRSGGGGGAPKPKAGRRHESQCSIM